jgi:hypothetical protein
MAALPAGHTRPLKEPPPRFPPPTVAAKRTKVVQ